jgi:hypothetical protein
MRVDPDIELPRVMIRVHVLCEQYARSQDIDDRKRILNEFSELIGHAAEVAAWDMVALILERDLDVEDANDDALLGAERHRRAQRLQGYRQPA